MLAELELAGHAVRALSIGGIETAIDLPRLKVAFDVGRCPPALVARDTILFTHCHMDHMGGVAYHAATRALRRMAPPTYVLPRGEEEALEGLFEAWRRLDRSELPHEKVPLAPGEEHVLPGGLVVRPVAAVHTVRAQGYVLWSRRDKLKPEFHGLPGEELRDLRVRGVAITAPLETPEVAFSGDTRIELLEREESVRRARLLILETTFLDGRVSVEECRAKGHVHLDELVPRAELFENEAILFTHFSARYRRSEIEELLDAKLPASLRERVTPLLPPPPSVEERAS